MDTTNIPTVKKGSNTPFLPIFEHKPDPNFCLPNGRIELFKPTNGKLIDQRTWYKWIAHRISAILQFCYLAIIKIIPTHIKLACGISNFKYLDLTNKEILDSLDSKKSTTDLYVFIPGLSAHPYMWINYVKAIEKKYSTLGKEVDIRVIKNKKNGKQKFEATVSPIKAMLEKYCKKNPNARIAIIGTSLGALSASQLEVDLRTSNPTNPVFVGSITGAYGSKTVSLLNKIPCIANLFLPIDLRHRFSHDNQYTKALIKNQRQALPEGCERELVYYGGMDETMVLPTSNEHPLINNENVTERHYNVYGAGHIGTTEAVTDHLLKQAFTFHKLKP